MNKKSLTILALFVLSITPGSGWAAFVTTNQADMNTIYSQASFGPNAIDVRFQPTISIANPSLLNINTLADLNALFSLMPVAPPGINMYFVDTVTVCSVPSPSPTIDGCATINGNSMVVASLAAADPAIFNGVTAGAILNSHELAHNLGLPHNNECNPPISMPPNLMDCQLASFDLTGAQVTAILANTNALQMDATGLFVDITPIVIVPLPAALPLMLTGLGMLAGVTRRRTSAPA